MQTDSRSPVRSFLHENRRLLLSIGILALLLLLLMLLRGQTALMGTIAGVSLWIRQALGALFSPVPFSVMELLIAAAVVGALAFLALSLRRILRARGNRPRVLLRRLLLAANAVLALLLALWLFLGASYYAPGFAARSGITPAAVETQALYRVTLRFAEALNLSSGRVERDSRGAFAVSEDEIFDGAQGLYDGICTRFPFLEAPETQPKKLLSSRLMSAFGYTGIYFPFTGEANINTDAPACLMPATIAHELAHQRGVASEQEANFVAILACLDSGNPVYLYSGLLSGFIHLSNALYQADPALHADVWATLAEPVLQDIYDNNAYWAQFDDSAASQLGEQVYDSFLKSYGQDLGVRSYGAVVDLLVAYYDGVLLTAA